MIKLSAVTWQYSAKIFDKIILHPFNQALMQGTLSIERFTYYMEQDGIYVVEEGKFESIIASRIKFEYIDEFQKYASGALEYRKEIDLFFEKEANITKTGELAPATLGYTSYLLGSTVSMPVEILVAALLPCFWYYREIGEYFASHPAKNNPYQEFIDSYASEEYSVIVDELIDIFDDLASKAPQEIRAQMIDAFYKSAIYEWHFYEDTYGMMFLDNI